MITPPSTPIRVLFVEDPEVDFGLMTRARVEVDLIAATVLLSLPRTRATRHWSTL